MAMMRTKEIDAGSLDWHKDRYSLSPPPTLAAYPRAQWHSGGATMQTTVRGFKHDDLERPETRSVVDWMWQKDLILECFQKRLHRAKRRKRGQAASLAAIGAGAVSPAFRPVFAQAL
jgi:hypothetical protein